MQCRKSNSTHEQQRIIDCTLYFQLVAGFADIDQTEDDDDSSQSTKNSKYLFGTLIFVLRDYQAGSDFGEDVEHFAKIVSLQHCVTTYSISGIG